MQNPYVSAHNSIHANQIGQSIVHSAQLNPIYQRQDFQNRRSASEPAHEPQHPGRNVPTTTTIENSTTNNPNNSNDTNYHGGDFNCLQKITTIKVR